MDRPARKQVNAPAKLTVNVEQAGTYNIWYNRWGGEGKKHKGLEKAERRCNMKRDMGYTKAQPGSAFCLHFSRGCCMKGHECNQWHRAPLPEDREDQAHDCFGRERFSNDREDMGGVGSFERDNRTLYVGNIKAPTSEMEAVVRRHFSDWGEIEHINVLFGKNVAFVRYVRRYNAEFAREAMYGQSLDSNEVLNVRWATDDPNPRVIATKKRKVEEHISETIQQKLPRLGDRGTILDYENYYADPNTYAYGYDPSAVAALPPQIPAAAPAPSKPEGVSDTMAFLADASNATYGVEEQQTGQGADGNYNGWTWDGYGWRYTGGGEGAAAYDPNGYDPAAYQQWYEAQGYAAGYPAADGTAAGDTTAESGNGDANDGASTTKPVSASALSSLVAGYASDEDDESDGKDKESEEKDKPADDGSGK